MLICQHHRMQDDETNHNEMSSDCNWYEAGRQYGNLQEAAQFIAHHHEHAKSDGTVNNNSTTYMYDPLCL